jgi:hypothetical protein
MLPKLIDFEWRTDVNMASNFSSTESANKTGQTCVVRFKVCNKNAIIILEDEKQKLFMKKMFPFEQIQDVDKSVEVKNLNVEFSKQTLNTMLDGLMKIKQQLLSISTNDA